jgi:urate oxidase
LLPDIHPQATLFRMARLIIAQNAHVQTVSYALPNKHYIPVDMGYVGVENLVPCVHLLSTIYILYLHLFL